MAVIFLVLFSLFISGQSSPFLETKVVRAKIRETQLHFYVQDIAGGENPTVYEVARASITENSSSRFGQVKVMDHLMTAAPEQNSTSVGRVQGLITGADLAVMGFATNLNFYFTYGNYSGSTISIVGRNEIGLPSRELLVVGGTGAFRFTTGYAFCTTYSYTAATSHTVLEYTLFLRSIATAKKSSRNFV